MQKKNCQIIITGHNNHDKVETFLQNIIRGSSIQGITNLRVYKKLNKKIGILRPLINFSRQEISWICRLLYLPIWSDVTNYNFSIKRNRIRHELIPYLQNYFNPQIRNSLNKIMTFCQYEDEYIKENTLKLYIKSTHNQILNIDINTVYKQHKILQQRVIKLFFYYHFQKQISETLLNNVIALTKSRDKHFFYFDKLKIQYYNGHIYVTQEYNKTTNKKIY